MEHINEIIRYINRTPDVAIINSTTFSSKLLEKYAKEGDYPILNNCTSDRCLVYSEHLVDDKVPKVVEGDLLERSLIRHDPDKLASVLIKILP